MESQHAQVFKVTRRGTFGEHYHLQDGRLHQRNCRPLEYLARLRLWKDVCGSAPAALGVTVQGQIVSSDKFISGELPSQKEVDSFIEDAGFEPIIQRLWYWRKIYRPQRMSKKRLVIELGDARDENFIKTSSGIVPIDIRIWGIHQYTADVA